MNTREHKSAQAVAFAKHREHCDGNLDAISYYEDETGGSRLYLCKVCDTDIVTGWPPKGGDPGDFSLDVHWGAKLREKVRA